MDERGVSHPIRRDDSGRRRTLSNRRVNEHYTIKTSPVSGKRDSRRPDRGWFKTRRESVMKTFIKILASFIPSRAVNCSPVVVVAPTARLVEENFRNFLSFSLSPPLPLPLCLSPFFSLREHFRHRLAGEKSGTIWVKLESSELQSMACACKIELSINPRRVVSG